MNDEVDRLNNSIDAIKAAEHEKKLPLSLEERSRRLALVCRAAAAVDRDRRQAGLPESQPEPWPKSTWEFLAMQTRRARKQA
jgi:hypothetical protein